MKRELEHGVIAKLVREMGQPYQTIYGYTTGIRRPKKEMAEKLAQKTGRGSAQEIVTWMSGDASAIRKMLNAWSGPKEPGLRN